MALDEILLDACVAINLAATHRAQEIMATLGTRFLMATKAAEEIGDLITADGRSWVQRCRTGATPELTAEVLALDASELRTFVDLAIEIDDGEAATIAVGSSRGLPIATDDRKARKVCQRFQINRLVGTMEILHAYDLSASLPRSDLTAMLQRVRDKAGYIPRTTDPHWGWWSANLLDAGQ